MLFCDFRLFLAIGLDNGFIELRQLVFNTISGDLEIVRTLHLAAHDLTVNQLCFQPKVYSATQEAASIQADEQDSLVELLASCSDDHTVKLHRVFAIKD